MRNKPDERPSVPIWLVVVLISIAVLAGVGLCAAIPFLLLWYYGT